MFPARFRVPHTTDEGSLRCEAGALVGEVSCVGPLSGGEGRESLWNIKGCLAGETRPASLSLQLFGLSCGFEAHSSGNVSTCVGGGKFVLSTISSISRTLTRPW